MSPAQIVTAFPLDLYKPKFIHRSQTGRGARVIPNRLLRAKIAAATAGVLVFSTFAGSAAQEQRNIALPSTNHVVHQLDIELLTETSDAPTSIGVADSNLYNLSQADLVDRLNQMKSLGVTDLRVAVPWVYIQPTSTSYDWTKMDNVVDTATSMGFSITGAITGNPVWGGTPIAGAPDPTAYANFASAVATRYATKIGAYEIWNEPNGVIFFAPVSAAKYTEVLKAAYTAIKAANPEAIVLAGALGATGTIKGISLSPQQFLTQMYAAGAAGYFDALSYHPYGSTLPFSSGTAVTNSALQQIQALYSIMVANGDGDLKIWGTEYGNATTPGIGITKAEQAQYLQDFITAWTRLSFTGPAFVYTAEDLQTGALNAEANFGLFNSDGTPKPAALLLAKLIADLDSHGALPDYTAPAMSLARDAYLQLASIGFGLVNTALIIPHAIISAAYEQMPTPAKQAFRAVANYVSAQVARMVTAIAPIAQAGIGALLNIGAALQNPQAAVHAAIQRFNRDLQSTAETVAAALNGTKVTLTKLSQPDAAKAAKSGTSETGGGGTDTAEESIAAAEPETDPDDAATSEASETGGRTATAEQSTAAAKPETDADATVTPEPATEVNTPPDESLSDDPSAVGSPKTETTEAKSPRPQKHSAPADASTKPAQSTGRHYAHDEEEAQSNGSPAADGAPASTATRDHDEHTSGSDTAKHRNDSQSDSTASGTTKTSSTPRHAQAERTERTERTDKKAETS